MDQLLTNTFLQQVENKPILMVGPTASGKSKLALFLAQNLGRVIINADAIQIYKNWRILTARPSLEDEQIVEHYLYGHKEPKTVYSVGHWLREIKDVLENHPTPIIVGGTGLYFSALTSGLSDIPEISDDIKQEARQRLLSVGIPALLADLDNATLSKIDIKNPMRVARAWEVAKATGRSLLEWHENIAPSILEKESCTALVINPDKQILNQQIKDRFKRMVQQGAIQEAEQNLPTWGKNMAANKAIGAKELIMHLNGEISLETAIDKATIATRQYAKRQKTWIKAKMADWQDITGPSSEKIKI
jgi:tRNA dimethylallyltransferase